MSPNENTQQAVTELGWGLVTRHGQRPSSYPIKLWVTCILHFTIIHHLNETLWLSLVTYDMLYRVCLCSTTRQHRILKVCICMRVCVRVTPRKAGIHWFTKTSWKISGNITAQCFTSGFTLVCLARHPTRISLFQWQRLAGCCACGVSHCTAVHLNCVCGSPLIPAN